MDDVLFLCRFRKTHWSLLNVDDRFDDDDDDIDEEDAPFLATPRRCYHLPGDWLQLRRDLSASQSQSSASQPSA